MVDLTDLGGTHITNSSKESSIFNQCAIDSNIRDLSDKERDSTAVSSQKVKKLEDQEKGEMAFEEQKTSI